MPFLNRRAARPRSALLALISLVIGSTEAFGSEPPPEIVPFRVPGHQVSKWFPDGDELKGMTFEAFQSLRRRVAEAIETGKKNDREPVRLLRSKHEMTWKEGVFEGASSYTVDSPETGLQRIRMNPWTPALDPSRSKTDSAIVTGASGDVFLVKAMEKGKNALAEIAWKHQARPGSQGKHFKIGLPKTPIREIRIEIPKTLRPDDSSALIRGPFASNREDHWIWIHDGAAEAIDLALVDAGKNAESESGPSSRFWGERSTTIELHDASGTLTSDWTLSNGPKRPNVLRFHWPTGLEILGVEGLDVVDFKVRTDEPAGAQLTIRLAESSGESATSGLLPAFSIRAMVAVPHQGPWRIPSIRAVNGIVTRGRTVVHIGPNRVVEACESAGGYRTERKRSDKDDGPVFQFDDRDANAESIGTLNLQAPRNDVSVDIRGELFAGNSVPRLDAYLSWKIHRGRRLNLDVDLPRAWIADRVELVGNDEPLAWHPEVRPGGLVRLHIALPAGDWSGMDPLLKISAIATTAGGRGSLSLPRIRPLDSALVDETWIATVEEGFRLVPTAAKGLAWIDPLSWTPFANPTPSAPSSTKKPADTDPNVRKRSLAWRWLTEDGEARVDREQVEESASASIRVLNTLSEDHVELLAKVAIRGRSDDFESLAIGLDQSVDDPGHWRFKDEATGRSLIAEPLDQDGRAKAKLPGMGTAWRITLPALSPPGRRTVVIEHRAKRSGIDTIPLVLLPTPLMSKSVAVVRASRNLLTELRGTGVRALDADVAIEATETSNSAFQPSHAFEYDAKTPPIELQSRSLTNSEGEGDGLIEELRLRSMLDQEGPTFHRFDFQVRLGEAKDLSVEVPEGTELALIKRDGVEVVPQRDGRRFTLPLRSNEPKTTDAVSIRFDLKGPPWSAKPDRKVMLPAVRLSLSVLAASWSVQVPEHWKVIRWEGPLRQTDPFANLETASGWPFDGFRPWFQTARPLKTPPKRIAGPPARNDELGVFLARLNSSETPIVVDRLAVQEVGAGPRTRLAYEPATETDPFPAITKALRSIDLAIVPIGGSFLVTSLSAGSELVREESAASTSRNAWLAIVDQIITNGQDSTSRFQGVSYWLDRGSGRGGISGLQLRNVDDSRRIHRFTMAGWPVDDAALEIEVGRNERTWQFAALWVALLAFWVVRSLPVRVRRDGFAIVLIVIAIDIGLLGPQYAGTLSIGVVAGASLGLALEWTGWLRRRLANENLGRTTRGRRDSVGSTVTASSIALFVLAGASIPCALAANAASDPIVVLYPYEGIADPDAIPGRVIMRLDDFKRLDAAASVAPSEPSSLLEARSIVHRLRRPASGDVEVGTEIDLILTGGQATDWAFPIGESRRISATLDGVSVPLTIEPGAQTGRVRIVPSDKENPKAEQAFRLAIRRTVGTRLIETGSSIRLPVNSHPRTRVEWTSESGGWEPAVVSAIPNGSGGATPSGSVLVGPLQTLEARWDSAESKDRPRSPGVVESLYLWDATPAGDRITGRYTFKNHGSMDTIRLSFGTDLFIKNVNVPGVVDLTSEMKGDLNAWQARIEPALLDGTTVEIEFWRPNPAAGGPHREAPRIEVIGFEKQTAVVGFRRPPDWTGRLSGGPGNAEAVTEESFARAWGMLPEEPLTLSGAVRLANKENRLAWPSLNTGPESPRLRIQPNLRLIARTGRVDFNLDATLSDSLGTSHEVRLDLPERLRIVQVVVEGLTSWSPMDERSIRVRFDGPGLAKRRLRVVGWIAVENDPLRLSSTTLECPAPWASWSDDLVETGSLSITASTRFELLNSPGAIVVSSDQQGLGPASGSPNRITYRVENAKQLGTLRWESEPPRVNAKVLGTVTIDPDSALWQARLRYDVTGGPLESIHLKLPTLWGRNASVQILGIPHQQVSESRGETTYWSIRPDRPVWGSVQMIVRSTLPFRPGDLLTFPDIGPLGRGEVDTYLELANATRSALAIEGSSGLQPVAVIPVDFEAVDVMNGPFGSSTVSYYHVLKPGWTLRARHSRSPAAQGKATPNHAELEVAADEKGGRIGKGVYGLAGIRELFLGVRLPPSSRVLLAKVDGRAVPVFGSSDGRRLLPTNGRHDLLVELYWKTTGDVKAGQTGGRPVPPEIEGIEVPTLLTMYAPSPSSLRLDDRSKRWSAVNRNQVDLELATWTANEIRQSLNGIDRSSTADIDRLVESIRRFETHVERIHRRAFQDPGRPRPTISPGLLERLDALESGLKEALASYSLDEFQATARASLGQAGKVRQAISSPLCGFPTSFQGTMSGAGGGTPSEPPVITIDGRSPLPIRGRTSPVVIATVLAIEGILGALSIVVLRRRSLLAA